MSTDTLINAERPHHPLSPSKLQYLEACSRYESTSSTNERAIAGTMAHGMTETGDDDHRLSDDDAAAAAECMDFYEQHARIFRVERAKAVEAAAIEAVGGDKEQLRDDEFETVLAQIDLATPPVVELTEIYLPIDDCKFTLPDGKVMEATTAGYVDRAVIDYTGTRAKMMDWKFGMWPVEEASNNLQGIAYALGLMRKFPKLQTVQFFFKQPHLHYITDATFQRCELPALYLRIQTVVARALAARKANNWNDATPLSGVCNFCANLGQCPKVQAIAFNVAKKFHPLGVPENITPTFCDSPENTALAINLAAVVKTWAEAYRRQVSDRIVRREQGPPPGFTLSTRSDREVVDEKMLKAVTLRYLTPDELDSISSFPFGKAEKILSDKAPRGQKTAMVEEFQQTLLQAGAVKKGAPYAFLRAVASRKDKAVSDENEITD